MAIKDEFENKLRDFVSTVGSSVALENGEWTVKGFIDIFRNVYTISSDTKIVSKILEIHLFPAILRFAEENGYKLVLAQHQNYYPDISFVLAADENVRFAVDFKTTYRRIDKPHLCNGFTLGSHGEYFINRTSTKNIQFPYASYLAHYCLGIIYDRAESATIDETTVVGIDDLQSVASVVGNFQFFVQEKWKIGSDRRGSGNTANIGSICNIDHILNGKGMFSKLGEEWFDDYWMNYNKISITSDSGDTKTIKSLREFVSFRNGDVSLIVERSDR